MLHRSDFFPGLGWMLTRDLWLELEPKWPISCVPLNVILHDITMIIFRMSSIISSNVYFIEDSGTIGCENLLND